MLRVILKRQVGYFFSLLLVASFFFKVQSSYAIYSGVRSVSYSESSRMCSTGDIQFDPFGSNRDINWELSNPICITYISIQGALFVTTGIITDVMCRPTNVYGQNTAQAEAIRAAVVEAPTLSPATVVKMAARISACTTRSANLATATTVLANCMATAAATAGGSSALCATASTQVGLATADQSRCCTSMLTYLANIAAGVTELAIIYAVAKGAFQKARICGHDWDSWKMVDENGSYTSSLPKNRWRRGGYPGSRKYCIEDIFVGHTDPTNPSNVIRNSCGYASSSNNTGGIFGAIADPGPPVAVDSLNIRNLYFREYLYGGKEFIDVDGCENPSSWNEDRKIRSLGYSGSRQRYYMKGPGVAANYACHRFILDGANDAAAIAAYECCKSRSRNTICIENAPLINSAYERKFCELGSFCTVKGVTFEPYASRVNQNFICAKTYSVCPYNHLLGGGTEIAQYATDSDGRATSDITNFCQYRKHCVRVPMTPYVRISNLEGAYISSACRNMRGDSQNTYSYEAGLLPVSTRGFSAPIVQCFKETLENSILNRAGDTLCRNPDERPSNGACSSGYFYREGEALTSPGFFGKVQDAVRGAIKIVLTLSIAILGAMVLIGSSQLSKKQLLMYILKIGLIMYFALGNGWQSGFVQGILGSSNYVSDIMMKLDYATGSASRMDGCQFPRFNYADSNDSTRHLSPAYPLGKEYLKVWDTLDCKLARALGFGPQVSVPNLIIMILAGFLTGGLGLLFVIGTMLFAFFMLSVVIRAIHIFLMASVAIVLLLYISPITITLALFERTKGIFEGWWKQILGLALQPVILFAYLGVYISLFDNMTVGSAEFRGNGYSAPKSLVCNDQARNDSIYCIFGIADSPRQTLGGLEIIGIGLPVLASMNKDKVNTIIKSAFLMFIFAGFMDKISTLAEELVGGSGLHTSSISVGKMAGKAFNIASGIQKRGMRTLMKHGGNIAAGVARRGYRKVLNQVYKGVQPKNSLRGKGENKPDSSKNANTPASSDDSKKPNVADSSKGKAPDAMPDESKNQKFSDAAKKNDDMLF